MFCYKSIVTRGALTYRELYVCNNVTLFFPLTAVYLIYVYIGLIILLLYIFCYFCYKNSNNRSNR